MNIDVINLICNKVCSAIFRIDQWQDAVSEGNDKEVDFIATNAETKKSLNVKEKKHGKTK